MSKMQMQRNVPQVSFLDFIEGSYSTSNVPAKFYVSVMFRPEQLLAGTLKGLTGITGNIDVAKKFVQGDRTWKCTLVMDGQEVIKLNRLSRIMYDNPHYLGANIASTIKRVAGPMDRRFYDAKTDYDRANALAQMLVPNMYGIYQEPFPKDFAAQFANEIVKYKPNSVDGYAKILVNMTRDYTPSSEWIKPFAEFKRKIEYYLKNHESIQDYKDEQEWIVKPDYKGGQTSFKIPNGTVLHVFCESPEEFRYWHERIEASGLPNKYQVFYNKDYTFSNFWQMNEMPPPPEPEPPRPSRLSDDLWATPDDMKPKEEPRKKFSWLKALGFRS